MDTQVKICGLRRPEDVLAVNEAKADFAGFVFYEKSKRCISEATARDLLKRLDAGIRSVAVCVDPDEDLLKQFMDMGFDRIQIHGNISPALSGQIRAPLWQAVNLTDRDQLKMIASHPNICGYLIDGARFGSGQTFGWESGSEEDFPSPREIKTAIGEKTFILAGGLTVQNVKTAIRLFAPNVVDVSTGVEKDGGKDRELIFQFIREVRGE